MIDKVKKFDKETKSEFLKDTAALENEVILDKDIHIINVNIQVNE